MRIPSCLAAISLAALSLSALAPAVAQDAPTATTVPRQPTGAAVPDPMATPGTSRDGNIARDGDPVTTGTIRSRETRGLPQSPENLNVLGCKQIDPLCQEERPRAQ